MNLVLHQDAVPLRLDASGTLRVGSTRVTLDVLLAAYNSGTTAEQLVEDFSSLQLADVYSVLGYYLRHREELEREYLLPREREAEEMRKAAEARYDPVATRERLLARKAQLDLGRGGQR